VSEVSYQAFLAAAGGRTGAHRPLDEDAIGTRPKEATRKLTVRISKRQERWLERVEAHSGEGVDRDAVVRALIDLGRELDIDWELLAGGGQLRAAVRDAVLVRRTVEP
jgi:hypothetical protein